jgi:hypothetical protein
LGRKKATREPDDLEALFAYSAEDWQHADWLDRTLYRGAGRDFLRTRFARPRPSAATPQQRLIRRVQQLRGQGVKCAVEKAADEVGISVREAYRWWAERTDK